MLTPDQVACYQEQGYLHIPQVFTPAETDALADQLDYLLAHWAVTDQGWVGPWRKAYMDDATEQASQLTHLHDLQFYSVAWLQAVTKPTLAQAMHQLLGGAVELHHSTLHIKPPETGHPFPMHQDMAFYEHVNDRFVDVLVHLDDTCHANGEIRFLAGSHHRGYLPHITQTPDGPCTPHLPTDQYSLADTVPVPAKRGDVVCFNVNTIHGSHINTTDKMRRLIRIGYRDPHNTQLTGQSCGRPGLMVWGLRERVDEPAALTTELVG